MSQGKVHASFMPNATQAEISLRLLCFVSQDRISLDFDINECYSRQFYSGSLASRSSPLPIPEWICHTTDIPYFSLSLNTIP